MSRLKWPETDDEKKKDNHSDTIAAIITPPGTGGLAAVRLAGSRSLSLLSKHFRSAAKDSHPSPFLLRYGHFMGCNGGVIDEVTAVYMPQGRSYTGQDQVEIFCHGGRHLPRIILNELLASGARAAEPGEFTKMAFLSGRIDLSHAEAVAEIIEANTDSSFRAAREHLLGAYTEHITMLRNQMIELISEIEASIDFPEEDLDIKTMARMVKSIETVIAGVKSLVDSYTGGRIIREGYTVAIAGRSNAGKSSLFNLLLKQERALVMPTPGTTRDYLSEWIDLGGFAVKLVDTAGLRSGAGKIEKAGQESAMKIISGADLVIWVIDLNRKKWLSELKTDLELLHQKTKILAGNKIDLVPDYLKKIKAAEQIDIAPISCLTGKGTSKLKQQLTANIDARMPDLTSGITVTSARHRQKLNSSLRSLRRTRLLIKAGETPEITAFELRQAVNAIDEITGKVYTEDILDRIFSKFCVGK